MSESGNVRQELLQVDAIKYTVMTNMAPIFPRNSSQMGTYANSNRSGNSFVAMVFFLPKLRSIPDSVSWNRIRCGGGCKSTYSIKGGRREKANNKPRKELAQATQATQTSIPARTAVVMDTG